MLDGKETTLTIRNLTPYIGAEVTGIDLTRPIDAATRDLLYAALVEHIALVIRGQSFTPRQFADAVALFGDLMDQDSPQHAVPEAPLLRKVSNRNLTKSGQRAALVDKWHTDHTNHVYPPKFTSLYAVELPDSGGGTSVVNMRAGYDVLPDDVKARIAGMQTVNVRLGSASKEVNPGSAEEQAELKPGPVLQPLVRTNPDNGTKALYFHTKKTENIVGMTPQASQDFLDELLTMAARPAFAYTHTWQAGDMFIWDNRSCLHMANYDYDQSQHRLLYRALVQGELPY
jgi:alpha-ketoglutarate-dependent taurine dioxygenase